MLFHIKCIAKKIDLFKYLYFKYLNGAYTDETVSLFIITITCENTKDF
jgi:hypothetical protein